MKLSILWESVAAGIMENKMIFFVMVISFQFSLIRSNKSYNGKPSQDNAGPLPVCPYEYRYNPVCGSDNITYINKNILHCTNDVSFTKGYPPITEVSEGDCPSLECQNINLPVCTLEGQTYPNECDLGAANIRRIRQKQPIIYLAYRQACVGPPCNCTTIASPVCGTDDILYRNECVLDCTSDNYAQRGLPRVYLKNNGACLDGCLCPLTKDQVCGSDGKFYDNSCLLECQNKKNNGSKYDQIRIADNSVCESCSCAAMDKPVCGSDGRTYANPCELNCESKRKNIKNLYIKIEGACAKCYCQDEDSPVCGSNHKTYPNECTLRCENEARKEYVGIFHYGACQSYECDCKHCSDTYEPVCGNHKQTYWNSCWLECNSDCYQKAGYAPVVQTQQGACSY